MAAIGQFGVKAVVDIDWGAELAEGTDGALCDSTGALKPELRVNAVEVQPQPAMAQWEYTTSSQDANSRVSAEARDQARESRDGPLVGRSRVL